LGKFAPLSIFGTKDTSHGRVISPTLDRLSMTEFLPDLGPGPAPDLGLLGNGARFTDESPVGPPWNDDCFLRIFEGRPMGTKGIYTAVSGAMAQDARLDTIANNIANANTPAYKRDAQLFREYLASYEKTPDVLEVPKVPASIESFYNMQGGDKSYVDNIGTYTDFSQGGIRQTGNPLDIAIEGKGFFEVLSPHGLRYSRAGNFSLDNEGRLVTKDGYPVLAAGAGGAPENRVIRLNGPSRISISPTGEIMQNDQPLARISTVGVSNTDALQKVGLNLYKLRDTVPVTINPNPDVTLHSGAVETSNVNIVQEMTDMIGATRTFESLQKAIKAYDEMNDKLVNQIPRL
jgi:flagellar basal-body rod protein FlgG